LAGIARTRAAIACTHTATIAIHLDTIEIITIGLFFLVIDISQFPQQELQVLLLDNSNSFFDFHYASHAPDRATLFVRGIALPHFG
jgi:hypothetical protein